MLSDNRKAVASMSTHTVTASAPHERSIAARPSVALAFAVALLPAQFAGAWVLTISSGPKAAFLQVGNGSYSGTYQSGGTPLNNATVNTVSVTVPANVVGRGIAQQMTSNSTQSVSFYDNFAVCNPPIQVYIGGWVRTPTGTGSAVLSVTSPAALTSATTPATIPFTQISWTSTANGNTAPDIPAGTFTGGTQALRTIAAGTWVENCHTFFYANTAVVSAATYTGQVTYTLVLP